MKRIILITLITLGVSGCSNDIEYAKVTRKESNEENCSFTIMSGFFVVARIHNCPCDKYKIGDNPFKCDSL